MTVGLLLAAALIAALLLWTFRVRRVMLQRQEMVESARHQRDKYRRKAARGRASPRHEAVLARSESIYRQSLDLYHRGLRHPLYRPFAAALGFRPVEEAAEEQNEETNTTTPEGGTNTMQKMEKVSNIRVAMFEMFGVGSDPAAKETALAKAEVVEILPAEAVEAVPAAAETVPAAAETIGTQGRMVPNISFLACGTVWEGSLRAEGDLDISGEFHGDITTKGCATIQSTVHGNVTAGDLNLLGSVLTGDVVASGVVTISREARITGSVTAREVRCAGQIEGDLTVSDTITLESTARIKGNTTTGSISVAQGAVINGGVEIKATR